MTDPHDPLDDALRDALRAEAAGVEADHHLLDRITAVTSSPDPSRRRYGRLLAVAAAFVVAAGTVGVLTQLDDGDGDRGLVEVVAPPSVDRQCGTRVFVQARPDADLDALAEVLGGDGRLTMVEPTEPPLEPGFIATLPDRDALASVHDELVERPDVLAVLAIGCPGDPAGDRTSAGPRPSLIALVRQDGMLMTVEPETGEERELLTIGDPRDDDPIDEESGGMGGSYIDAVDLSPDGRWVYYSACCEPAVGMTFRIPVEGGPREVLGFGYQPRVSPDGRHVATIASGQVFVLATDRAASVEEPTPEAVQRVDTTGHPQHLAWSPDGTRLAYVEFDGAGPWTEGRVHELAWDGSTLTPVGAEVELRAAFVGWRSDGTIDLLSGEPLEDDRSFSQDASYEWRLWVDEEGVVLAQAGPASGDRLEVFRVPLALVADW